jgi:hypothetical protein
MRWNIIVECVGEDGEQIDDYAGHRRTARQEYDCGKPRSQSSGIEADCKSVARHRSKATAAGASEHCEQRRKCLTCGRLRPIRMAMPNSTFRRCYGKGDGDLETKLRVRRLLPTL